MKSKKIDLYKTEKDTRYLYYVNETDEYKNEFCFYVDYLNGKIRNGIYFSNINNKQLIEFNWGIKL